MFRRLIKNFRRRSIGEINPDEIFIDSSNLPRFDTDQFEGRFEHPISTKTIVFLATLFLLIGAVFLSRLWILQVQKGESYAERSERNRLRHTDIFSNRGVIFDRNGIELASNTKYEDDTDFAQRQYASIKGIGQLIGYVKYPTKDSSGFYFRNSYVGEDGIEKTYNDVLSGKNGVRIVETDAVGRVQSESMIRPANDGQSITLTVDSRLQNKIYEVMEGLSAERGFTGGAAIIMDVMNGELISLVSFPEYNSSILSEGNKADLTTYLSDPKKPFLNRAISGLYTPGSIIKPIIALGALSEGVIGPEKKILSTGALTLPNPYFPDQPAIFRDWKVHGWVNMRQAIAVSSNVYFFEVGGGFEDQKGIGITNIEKYLKLFGLDEKTGINISSEADSIIPTPTWKEKKFNGDAWRLGDTYNTSIGQYGMQFTPLQVARYVSAIANEGILMTPRLVHSEEKNIDSIIPIKNEFFKIVKEGMRESVTNGTAVGVNVPFVKIAGKTGTAELGVKKEFVNSWTVGYFPYDNPKYAFVLLMEKGPRSNLYGATSVMRQVLDWMNENTPEYFE